MPILPPLGNENVASFPQRCSFTSETFTFFDFRSFNVATRSSHIRYRSCWSFFSASWNAASDGRRAKISQPWPASTDGKLRTSRKKARSTPAFLEWITMCAPLIIACASFRDDDHLAWLGGGPLGSAQGKLRPLLHRSILAA